MLKNPYTFLFSYDLYAFLLYLNHGKDNNSKCQRWLFLRELYYVSGKTKTKQIFNVRRENNIYKEKGKNRDRREIICHMGLICQSGK